MILLSSSQKREIPARVFTAANKFIDGKIGAPDGKYIGTE
jgi:hypothetical protein